MSSPARTRRRRAMREAARCPDCNSDVTIRSTTVLAQAQVRHSRTCPWWNARGAEPFTQVRLVMFR